MDEPNEEFKAFEKRVEIMRLALNLSGISCNSYAAEMLCRVSDAMIELGEAFSLKDAARIEAEVKEKYDRKEITTRQSIESILADMKQVVADLKQLKTPAK